MRRSFLQKNTGVSPGEAVKRPEHLMLALT